MITIPLTGTNTPPADMSTWNYTATSGTPGLITAGPTVEPNGSGGFNLVITLSDSEFVPGFSSSISLQVTPPNNTTPDHTTWSLLPTLSGGNLPVETAPAPSTGEATATPLPVITKVTADGGSVYLAGSTVTYTIMANCNSGSTGNLFLEKGSLSDPLPAGMTYVSSSPAGATVNGNTVTWIFPDGSSTPAGCAAGSTGPTTYQVVATAPDPAPPLGGQPLRNVASFEGTGPDATDPEGVSVTTTAEADIDVIDTPPTSGGGGPGYPTISKSSLAPLAIGGLPGNQYAGTYAGDWLPSSSTPSNTVGAAAGSFQVNVHFPLTGTYETDLIDPLPCLSDLAGNTYSSASPTGPPCPDPGLPYPGHRGGDAGPRGGGGRRLATLGHLDRRDHRAPRAHRDGVARRRLGLLLRPPGDVGTVASVDLPPAAEMVGNSLTLTLWGYADASLAEASVLANTATATPYLSGAPLAPEQATASLIIVPQTPQLGIAKSFGALGRRPGGHHRSRHPGPVSRARGRRQQRRAH